METALFLWALALLSATASAISNPSYMVVIPAIIYHPNVEKVCLLLSALKEAVHVEVTLETQTQNHTLVEKDVDKPGIFECVEFKAPTFVPMKRENPSLFVTRIWGSEEATCCSGWNMTRTPQFQCAVREQESMLENLGSLRGQP